MRIVSPLQRRPRSSPGIFLLALIAGAGMAAYYGFTASTIALPHLKLEQERFGLCTFAARDNCVIDGDTFVMDGERIRVADIDAPETSGAQCDTEAKLGNRAKTRLRELLNEQPFALRAYKSRDTDQYGRKLRVVMRDGRSIGDTLVAEGLARRWSGRRMPWCT